VAPIRYKFAAYDLEDNAAVVRGPLCPQNFSARYVGDVIHLGAHSLTCCTAEFVHALEMRVGSVLGWRQLSEKLRRN